MPSEIRVNRRALLESAAAVGTAAIVGPRSVRADDSTEITMWLDSFNGGSTSQCVINTVIEPFNASGNIRVKSSLVANSWDAMRTALAAGAGPDVLATPGPGRAFELGKAGQLLPLDRFVAEQGWDELFRPWALELGVVGGQLCSLPYDVETLVLYYNNTLFAEHGWSVPATMDELVVLAQAIDEAGIIPFAHCNQELRFANEWFVSEFLNKIAGPEKVYQALTGSAKFTDPEFVEAVAVLTQMQQRGWFMGGLDRYYTTGFAEANAAFADGDAAMKIEGTWWLPNGDVFWGPEAGNENEWDWTPVPAKDGRTSFTIGVASMGVNARTEHPDEVATFLTHFFAPDSQATLLTGCSFAPAPVAIPAERLAVLEPRHARLFTALSEASAANDYGYASWTFWPPKTETHLIEEIEKVWAGDMTPEEYLAEMQALFDEERAAGDALPVPAR